MSDIVNCVIKQLKCRLPVWFTCDIRHDFNASMGIASVCAMRDMEFLGLPRTIWDKKKEICTRNAMPLHAMLITGVKMKGSDPIRWRVQNSWGKNTQNNEGFIVVSHKWFERYVFHAVVFQNFTSYKSSEPKDLNYLDVLGTVAGGTETISACKNPIVSTMDES